MHYPGGYAMGELGGTPAQRLHRRRRHIFKMVIRSMDMAGDNHIAWSRLEKAIRSAMFRTADSTGNVRRYRKTTEKALAMEVETLLSDELLKEQESEV